MPMTEKDKMRKIIKQEVNSFIENLASELYNDESNFNNADKTSGQQVYTYNQIVSIIKEEVSKCNK